MSTELAWAAGFFDGEGCVYVAKESVPKIYGELPQVRREPLERFLAAVGRGYIAEKTRVPKNGVSVQAQYRWRLYKQEDMALFIAAMYPLLCAPKREQIDAAKEKCRW